ncbi:hypothetical protein ACSLFS_05795 [Priestia megaterium]|uniref:hypothetical protein n=1 Tax=Priestia megaterium TaxID=1404 RepID=UPI003EE341E9
MDATVKTTKSGIIGGILGGISLLYVIINTLLILNFFTGLIAAEKLQGLPIIAPIFLVPLMIVPAICQLLRSTSLDQEHKSFCSTTISCV